MLLLYGADKTNTFWKIEGIFRRTIRIRRAKTTMNVRALRMSDYYFTTTLITEISE